MIFFSNKKNGRALVSKLIVAILIVSFGALPLSSTLTPKHAEAQFGAIGAAVGLMVPVNDIQNNLKEGIFDQIAWSVAKIAIQQITRSTIAWINSGFQGNPAFVSDPGQFFGDLADQVLGEFIKGSDLAFLCSPFKIEITKALIQNYYQNRVPLSCTLSGVLNNVQNFANFTSVSDGSGRGFLANGGWRGWLDVAGPEGNNPYDAYADTQAKLGARLLTTTGNFQQELNFGQGFLSWRDCSTVSGDHGPGDSKCPIVTPGSVIVDQLNHTLGATVDTLVTADEFNEIISALMSQLLSQVLGGTGLFGTSQPNSSFNGGSFLNALNNNANTTFNGSRELSKSGIDANVAALQQMIGVKNQSIGKVNNSISLQNQIAQACGVNSTQAGVASSTVATQLQPIKNKLLSDIALANGYIAELNQFKAELNALSPGDTNGFNAIFSKYTALLNIIHPESIVFVAEDERDNTIPQQLSPIDSSAHTTINQCIQAKNQNNNPIIP